MEKALFVYRAKFLFGLMAHDQQAIERTKGNRRHHERSMPRSQRHDCDVFLPCEGGSVLYLGTLVWPTSMMQNLRSSPWILGAPRDGLTMLIRRTNLIFQRHGWSTAAARFPAPIRSETGAVPAASGCPVGRLLVHHTSWETVRHTPPNFSLSIDPNGTHLRPPRRSILFAASAPTSLLDAARDRGRSIAVSKISLHIQY